MEKTGHIIDTDDGLRRVREGNFAWLHEGPMVKYLTSRDCELTAVGEQFSNKPYAFALQEHSPLVEDMNVE